MKGPDQCAAPLRLRRIKSLKRKAGFLHKGPNNSSQDIFTGSSLYLRLFFLFQPSPRRSRRSRRGGEEAPSAPTGGQTH